MHSAPPRAFTVTFRMVLGIAVPMAVAHVTTPLIGVTDAAVIGQLGSATLIGAVAVGALFFDVLGTTFNFLRMATTGLVAQAMGAGDAEAEALTLARSLLLALIGGLLVLVLQAPVLPLFLSAMGASADVATATADYVGVRIWGVPFMFANYAILGWLLGLGRARTGLLLQAVLGGTNIVLSLALVLSLGWGIFGVALASVAAEVVAFVLGVAILRRTGPAARPSLAAVVERSAVLRLLAVNRDIFIRSALLVGAYAFFTSVSARYGDVTLAANAILLNLLNVFAYGLDGLATAAEQLGGRAVGARYRPAFDKAVRLTTLAGLALGAALTLAAFLGGGLYVRMMTTADDVRAVALAYLPFVALSPFAGALAFVMDGLFIGATWTRTMRDMMLASTLLFVLVWWIFAPWFGNAGLWVALLAYLAVRGVTLLAAVPVLARRTFGNAGRPAKIAAPDLRAG
jgi:MATE family multidrug resistance protein